MLSEHLNSANNDCCELICDNVNCCELMHMMLVGIPFLHHLKCDGN